MRKIKIDIISGFLGAGKTTFIMKLMKDIYRSESVVILENEFGKINIDKDTLKREKLNVKPVQAGCICCSGATDLLKGLEEIINEFHPERIIIEPTGIARLYDIKRLLMDSALMGKCEIEHIITIVDAKNYYKRVFISKDFFENQILYSEVIFLSKINGMKKEQLENVMDAIHKIQPRCHIVSKEWDTINSNELEELIQLKQEKETVNQSLKLFRKYTNDFTSYEIEEDMEISIEIMKRFLENMKKGEFGEIHRIKGICLDSNEGWYSLEGVPGESKFVILKNEIEENEKSKICIIGRELNRNILDKFFNS